MRRALVLLVAAALLGALAGCGAVPLTPLEASGGRLAQVADLHGARYVVAGGPTNELAILCQLTIAAVQAAGAQADDQCGRIGSVDVRRPTDQSEVDTGWAYPDDVDRDLDGRPDPPRPLAELAREDAAIGVDWLPTTAFGTVDAVVAPPFSPLRTVSALAASPGPLCAPPDADVGRLAAAYRLPPVQRMDLGSVFVGLARGGCAAGVVPGTSGRIDALGLVALDDDRGALASGPAGRGGAAPILRTSLVDRHPGVVAVLGEITRRLDDATVRRLDDEADQQGRDPRDVARTWLRAEGLIDRG